MRNNLLATPPQLERFSVPGQIRVRSAVRSRVLSRCAPMNASARRVENNNRLAWMGIHPR